MRRGKADSTYRFSLPEARYSDKLKTFVWPPLTRVMLFWVIASTVNPATRLPVETSLLFTIAVGRVGLKKMPLSFGNIGAGGGVGTADGEVGATTGFGSTTGV